MSKSEDNNRDNAIVEYAVEKENEDSGQHGRSKQDAVVLEMVLDSNYTRVNENLCNATTFLKILYFKLMSNVK